MSQISPPIRIVLVLAVAVLGVYMLFLRPKPEEIPPLEPAGTSTSQPGQIRDKAEEAVEKANSQLAQQESVDGVDAGEAAAGTAPATKAGKQGTAAKGAAEAAPAEDLKGLPKPVRKAIRSDKVLVILFSNGKSADDRAVATAMKKVDRWDGRVFVHTAPLTRISRYGRIARGVNVEQSPTVVVAGRDLRAETLVGYTDRLSIDQAVVDALRNERLFTSSYLRKVDNLCTDWGNKSAAIPHHYLANSTVPQMDRSLARHQALAVEYSAKFEAIKAPQKYAAFRSATIADHNASVAAFGALSTAVTPKSSRASVRAAGVKADEAMKPISKSYNARADALGLFRCGSQF